MAMAENNVVCASSFVIGRPRPRAKGSYISNVTKLFDYFNPPPPCLTHTHAPNLLLRMSKIPPQIIRRVCRRHLSINTYRAMNYNGGERGGGYYGKWDIFQEGDACLIPRQDNRPNN